MEIRGGGNATRQINHILKPEFPAHRLLIVEVYTPSGNWSSYPPHKHDLHNPPELVCLAGLPVGRKAHHFVLIAIVRKAKVHSNGAIQEAERMRIVNSVTFSPTSPACLRGERVRTQAQTTGFAGRRAAERTAGRRVVGPVRGGAGDAQSGSAAE